MITRLEASVHVIEPETKACPKCQGRGFTVYTIREMDGLDYDVSRACARCEGSGRLWRDGTPARARKERRLEA